MKKTLFVYTAYFIWIGLLFSSCFKEIDIYLLEADPFLSFNQINCGFDSARGIILAPVRKEMFPSFKPILYTNFRELTIGGESYTSGDEVIFEKFEDSITIAFTTAIGQYYEGFIYFTTLPVIQIQCPDKIVDEPKIKSQLVISDYSQNPNGLVQSYDAGIEFRGRTAILKPKQSYNIELWSDSSGTQTKNESILNMRDDDDWILDAMYIDKARMRNKVSMDLWRDICELSNCENYYGKPYTESKYIELFINLDYKGLYCLTERFDPKQLNIIESEGSIRGLLYKTEKWTNTTKFIELADTNTTEYWAGWEQKYPDPDEFSYWKPVYDFSDFVINSTDEEFEVSISDYLDLDNLVDYFIFINTCQATDNMGTNMIYSRNDSNSTFIIYPWDLDASWGRDWESNDLNHCWNISNKYYERIHSMDINNYVSELKDHWSLLRNELISVEKLMLQYQTNADLLKESGAFRRERKRWPKMGSEIDEELAYINSWTIKRLEFLDNLFNNFENKSLQESITYDE